MLISAKYDLYPKSKEDISDKVSEEEALEFAFKNNMFLHIYLLWKNILKELMNYLIKL